MYIYIYMYMYAHTRKYAAGQVGVQSQQKYLQHNVCLGALLPLPWRTLHVRSSRSSVRSRNSSKFHSMQISFSRLTNMHARACMLSRTHIRMHAVTSERHTFAYI